ncbi:MAG: BACON domain-containing protein [Anaerolineales bacterium]
MKWNNTQRILNILIALMISAAPSFTGSAQAQTEGGPLVTVQDTPVQLTGGVTSFFLKDPKLFWHLAPPPCNPTTAAAPQVATYESIQRVAARGGLSRWLYFETQACGTTMFQSNIVADDEYVYWTGPNGLMRLSTEANYGDAPELVNGLLAGRAELAIDGTHVFVMSYDNNNYATLYRVPKSSGTRIFMAGPGQNASNLQVSYSFNAGQQRYFAYWIQASDLRRFNVDTLATTLLAVNVTGYFAEGGRTSCGGNFCFFSDNVFIAQGNQVVIFSNLTGVTSAPVYCSNNPCSPDANRRLTSLTADGDNLFFFEERRTGCAPLCVYTDFLLRTPRSGGMVDTLYFNTAAQRARGLTTDGTNLYWQDSAVQRLPNNAAALPTINLLAAGLEVTQGIQDDANSVPFIQNRRTFVRFFVRTPQPGDRPVLALLSATWNGGSGGLLLPINLSGTESRIKVFQDHNNVNDSFLFELPWEWTTKSNLMLTATVNPYQFPLEPNYNDNTSTAGPFNFKPSPTLQVTLAGIGYQINNKTYYPDYQRDVIGAASLVRRMFPLANTNGGTGFQWNYWQLFDEGLATRVNRSHAECLDYISVENNLIVDRRNLCSSRYANHLLAYLRSAWKYSDKLFIYGMISSAGPGAAVRGQASHERVSSGAAENPFTAVHEIAHTLGRDHPFKGSSLDTKVCGNTPDDGAMDNNYPYANGRIGVGSLTGFDPGGAGVIITPTVKPNDQWFDIISYCGPQWISDYTYKGLYDYMIANPPQASTQSSAQVSGDWWYIGGSLRPDGSGGSISFVRRMTNPASVPPILPGDYALRLVNANGNTLTDHPFMPEMAHSADGYWLIDQAVPIVAGTRQIRVMRLANGQTLATWSLSANAPTVGNVALSGAPNPVTGTVTLNWKTGDPDGDPLTFDVLYSRDGGASFSPLLLNHSGQSAVLDTAPLSGGSAILRVVASDGGNSAQADSAPFTVAGKPPTVSLLTPTNGLRIHYGQLVNFSGEAFDVQDGWLSGAALVWKNAKGQTLGTGPLLSSLDLPVGTNAITLTATNSLSLSASASVTVIVDDDLNLPGPYLSVGPTQVNWHLAPGTVAAQTADVSVSNAGSGNLTWTASSDQPWLTLSAASGATPITLTVTANPSAFTEGNTYTATVTIVGTGGGGPPQTVTLPVAVAVGNVEDPVTATPARQVFLPLIGR